MLRASGVRLWRFTIVAVNHQNNYLENLEELPEIKSIRNQIEALQLKVEDEKAAITVLKEKEAFLVANRESTVTKETSFSTDQLKSVMDLYTKVTWIDNDDCSEKEQAYKDYEKRWQLFRNRCSDKTGKQQLPVGEISVSVSSAKPVTGKFFFSYVVSNAGWFPSI